MGGVTMTVTVLPSSCRTWLKPEKTSILLNCQNLGPSSMPDQFDRLKTTLADRYTYGPWRAQRDSVMAELRALVAR